MSSKRFAPSGSNSWSGLRSCRDDMVFFTQITMEAAEDSSSSMPCSRRDIKGALVGVEAVTPEGLKAVYKDFNSRAKLWPKRL